MSRFLGILACPECKEDAFRLSDWETYVSVTCRHCGHRMGELKEE